LDDCWIWTGSRTSRGYGQYRKTTAHRYSWILANGPIPEGLFACHSCDVPSCVRPDHLFLGTQIDNMRDAVAKGRTARGERSGAYNRYEPRGEERPEARFRDADVLEMRRLASEGVSHTELSRRFSAPRGTIHGVVVGTRYTHLPGAVPTRAALPPDWKEGE
jgi:hypothetical protein